MICKKFLKNVYNLLLNNNPLSWSELSSLKWGGGCYLTTFSNDENIDIFIEKKSKNTPLICSFFDRGAPPPDPLYTMHFSIYFIFSQKERKLSRGVYARQGTEIYQNRSNFFNSKNILNYEDYIQIVQRGLLLKNFSLSKIDP